MKNTEKEYKDGYYSARWKATLYCIPIQIADNSVLITGSSDGINLKFFTDILPLELPKPKRKSGYYKATYDGEDIIIEYIKDKDGYYMTGLFNLYSESEFEWIDDKPIEL